MKKSVLLTSLLILSFVLNNKLYAQADAEALSLSDEAFRLGQSYPVGSARIQALGGAQVSLGGDISSLLGNPAGLGFYNRSEISITPSLGINSAGTDYFGQRTNDYNFNLNLQNGGIVLTEGRDYAPSHLWRGGSYGISFSRTNDFYQRIRLNGTNPNNSIIDFFLSQADGIPHSQISEVNDFLNLAYETYLINPMPGTDALYGLPTGDIGIAEQSESIVRSGSQYQWNVSYGGNFDDVFYFGFGVGITSLDYTETKEYTEYFPEGDIIDIQYDSEVRVNGSGINATVGFIARPSNRINIGATIVTPTMYSLERETANDLAVSYADLLYEENDTLSYTLGNESATSDLFVSEYLLATPLKINGGLTYFFGKNGFITSDVEYLSYKPMQLSSNDFYAPSANEELTESYRSSSLNWRIGGEYRYNIFRLRGGFAYYGDPTNNEKLSFGKQQYTVGAGIKLSNYFIDLALVHNRMQMSYSPYYLQAEYQDGQINPFTDQPVAQINSNQTKAMVTLGWYF